MQSHPLDGDGLNVELFKLLGRVSRISVVNEALPFRIPDTIIYYGCASYWYYFDDQTNSVQKHPAKALEKTNVFEKFCQKKSNDRSDIVACFCSSRTENMEISYMDKEGLRKFLFSDKRQEHYGILQKFIEPKMDHCETVQVVHSPTMTFAVRRENRAKLYDRAVDVNLRCCGFDGPSYQCEEYFCLVSRTGTYKGMCDAFTSFFTTIEPRFLIKRLVAYFRQDIDEVYWLMYTSSVRIVERVDPELEQLWGKKVVPFAALKQSLGTVQTTWNANATNGSTASSADATGKGKTNGSVASAPSIMAPGVNSSAASGPSGTTAPKERLLQPLSLLPKEQLDRMTHVPSRAREIEALAKQLKEQSQQKKAIRAVPRRLLSPFQTVSACDVDEESDENNSDGEPRKKKASQQSIYASKTKRIKMLRERKSLVDKDNELVRQKLTDLSRDAASLCYMNELDKVAHRKPISNTSFTSNSDEDSELFSSGTDSPSSSMRRASSHYSEGPAALSRVATAAGMGEGSLNEEGVESVKEQVAHPMLLSDDIIAALSMCDAHNLKTPSVRSKGAVMSPSGRDDHDGMSRSTSVISTSVNLKTQAIRRRKSNAAGGRQREGHSRAIWSPRSYAARPSVAILLRSIETTTQQYAKERSNQLMHAAAVLSDIFYPLGETIAVRRKFLPKYMRYDTTYGEEEGIINVDEEGNIHFELPRDLLLLLKRELGAYWTTLRIELDSDSSYDGPAMPSTEEWERRSGEVESLVANAREELNAVQQEQEDLVATMSSVEEGDIARLEAQAVLLEGRQKAAEVLLHEAQKTRRFPERQVPLVVRPPFVNQSAYTFAPQKLQEIAEGLEKDARRYVEEVMRDCISSQHHDLFESLAEANTLRSCGKKDSSSNISPSTQELNPAANRARRTSMIQQLKSIPSRQRQAEGKDKAHLAVERGMTPAESPRSMTPSVQPTPRQNSQTSPSDEALSTAPDSERRSARRSTAPTIAPSDSEDLTAQASQPFGAVVTEESRTSLDNHGTPVKKETPTTDDAPGTPDWLK